MGAYERELKGVLTPGLMEGSLSDFARRIRVRIEEEQERVAPDNALISLLCDAARVGFELIEYDRRFTEPLKKKLRHES